MQSISVFNGNKEFQNNPDHAQKPTPPVLPSVYVGMFEMQLYVQENENLKSLIHRQHNQYEDVKFPRIPWKPYPAKNLELALIDEISTDDDILPDVGDRALVAVLDQEKQLALSESVLYASEGVNGNGFFLYSTDDFNRTQTAICDTEEDEENDDQEESNSTFDEFAFVGDDNTPVQIVIVSLWFWW